MLKGVKHRLYFIRVCDLWVEHMNISEVCRRGYFDNVIIDGYTMPLYNSMGIELHNNESLNEALDLKTQAYLHGLAKIRVNIYGKVENYESAEDITQMQLYRSEEIGLVRQAIGRFDRYLIGYVDIIIVKGNCVFPTDVESKGISEEAAVKVAKSDDQFNLIIQAIKMQRDKDVNIAIIDKIFIDKHFRRCGVASWIHNNIQEVVKVFGLIDINDVLLTPGDFTQAAESEFNMSTKQYNKMLAKHYRGLGYRFIAPDIMCKHIRK